jgi:hypothetical protein
MSIRNSHLRSLMIVMAWLAFGLGIGVVVSGTIWWVHLGRIGKSLGNALSGEVEDAISTLEGLLLLGCLIGGIVGLIYGLAVIAGRKGDIVD